MAQSIKKVTLDIMRENSFVYIAKQGDALSRFLNIQFTSSGTPVALPSDDKITLSVLRSDGVSVFVLGTVESDGTATVELTSGVLAAVGTALCDVSVISPSGAVLTTLSFVIEVEKGYRDDAALEAANQFPIFTKAISEMAAVEADIKASEAERVAAEEKRVMTNIRNGEAENSLEGADSEEKPAIALGEGCVSLGDGSIAGCMGYYIQAIDFDNKKIYLTDTKVSGLPKVGAGEVTALSVPYVYNVTAEPVQFSIINRLHYPLCGTIKSIENNVVTYEGDLGFTAFEDDTGVDGHVFYVPKQPTVGAVSFVTGAVSAGENVVNVGKCAFGAGRDLLLLEGYGANIGRRNTTGYGSTALGLDNYVPAQMGTALGNKNTVTGYAGVAIGQSNEVTETDGVAIGRHLKVYSAAQNARGKHNIPDAEGKYADIVGNGTSAVRSNAQTLDWDGNIRYAGKAYVECEKGIGEGKELATKEQFVQMIGTFEPLCMGTAIENDKHVLYNEVYNTLSYDILKDGDITYMHLEPSREVISGSSKCLNINRFTIKASDMLFSLTDVSTVYLKLLLRTNWSEEDRKQRFSLYRITNEDGTSTSSTTGIASENCVGNGEWESVIIPASVPEGSIGCPQVAIYVGGNKNLSTSTYAEGTYFDVAAWALFDNEELAEQFDMTAAVKGLPGLDFGQRLELKADKDLSNVDNAVFLQKAIDSGLVDYIVNLLKS